MGRTTGKTPPRAAFSTHTLLYKHTVVYCTQWKRSAPGGCLPDSYQPRLEYWIWEVSKMTMYEILSLAINVAILILGLLSYLK